MGISTSRLFDRRAYGGTIEGEYRMRSPSAASRSRTRGWRTATGPMPVMISRSGRWPWRTTRCWPVSVFRLACFARNSATSASTAWVSSARAPLRRISVKESVNAPGWASLMTLLSDTAYHSFIGEVGALNTTTIRRLTPSCRHQLLAIARADVRPHMPVPSVLRSGLSQSTPLAGQPYARGRCRFPAMLQRLPQMCCAPASPGTRQLTDCRGPFELWSEMAGSLHPVLYRKRAHTSGVSAPLVLLSDRVLRQPDLS